MTLRVHPFPYRTRKLSSIVPKILGGRLPGKIGKCQHKYSSIAQSVERMTVNHDVTGSSPVGGAKKGYKKILAAFSYTYNYIYVGEVRELRKNIRKKSKIN